MEKTIYTREYGVLLRLLKEAREQAGITQVQLAQMISQSQSFVSKFERGDRRIDLIQLRTICQVFGIRLREFVERLEREIAKAEPQPLAAASARTPVAGKKGGRSL